MNRSLMNKDLHSPAFIRASVPADKEEPLQVASQTTSSNEIKWSRIIRLTLLIGILSGGVYLLSKLVTAPVSYTHLDVYKRQDYHNRKQHHTDIVGHSYHCRLSKDEVGLFTDEYLIEKTIFRCQLLSTPREQTVVNGTRNCNTKGGTE